MKKLALLFASIFVVFVTLAPQASAAASCQVVGCGGVQISNPDSTGRTISYQGFACFCPGKQDRNWPYCPRFQGGECSNCNPVSGSVFVPARSSVTVSTLGANPSTCNVCGNWQIDFGAPWSGGEVSCADCGIDSQCTPTVTPPPCPTCNPVTPTPTPVPPECDISALSFSANAGEYISFRVTYSNLGAEPISIPVSCGNGLSAIAEDCTGTSGSCVATCYYPNGGRFTASTNIGNLFCGRETVDVYNRTQPTPTPTPVPIPWCIVNVTPQFVSSGQFANVIVYYGDSGATRVPINCGNGFSTIAQCNPGLSQLSCPTPSCPLGYNAILNGTQANGCQGYFCSPSNMTGLAPALCTTPNCQFGYTLTRNGTSPNGCAEYSCNLLNSTLCPVTVNCATGFTRYANGTSPNGCTEYLCAQPTNLTNSTCPASYCGAGYNLTITGNQSNSCTRFECRPSNYTGPTACSLPSCAQGYNLTATGNQSNSCTRFQCNLGNFTPPICSTFNCQLGFNKVQTGIANGCPEYQCTSPSSGFCVGMCYYPAPGNYIVTSSIDGFMCTAGYAIVSAAPCSCYDGTSCNSCSTNRPLYCSSDARLTEQATLCGCPPGKIRQGETCVFAEKSCEIVSTTVVQGDPNANLLINYRGFDTPPTQMQVACGNGISVYAACYGGSSGTCTANCFYYAENNYPKTYIATAATQGMACVTAPVTIVAPYDASGGLLVRVTDCGVEKTVVGTCGPQGTCPKKPIANARILVNNTPYYADTLGELRLFKIGAGNYEVRASADGYAESASTASVTSRNTTVLQMCLQSSCDFKAEVLGSTCVDPLQNPPQLLQLKFTNLATYSNSITLKYSSAVPISGPLAVTLSPGEARVVSFNPIVPSNTIGSFLTVASVNSAKCIRNLQIPMCALGGLEIQFDRTSVEAMPGSKACFYASVRNRGNDRSTVSMQVTDLQNSGYAYEVTPKEFSISPLETKQGIQFCVSLPSTATQAVSFEVKAASPISDATDRVSAVPKAPYFYTDFQGCLVANNKTTTTFPITLFNKGFTDDYELSLENANYFSTQVSPPMLLNFERDSSRKVFITSYPVNEGNYTVSIVLKKNGFEQFRQQVCLVSGMGYGQYGGSSFKPLEITYVKNAEVCPINCNGEIPVTIRNNARWVITNIRLSALLPAGMDYTSVKAFSLKPMQEKTVLLPIRVSASAPGTQDVKIIAESSNGSAERSTFVRVLPSVFQAEVESSAPSFEVTEDGVIASFNMTMQLTESAPITVTATLNGLPAQWAYNATPSQATLLPGESKTVYYRVLAKEFEDREYLATAKFSTSDGRGREVPIVLDFREARAGWFSGAFFVGIGRSLMLLVLILLFCTAMALFYLAWRNRRKLKERKEGK